MKTLSNGRRRLPIVLLASLSAAPLLAQSILPPPTVPVGNPTTADKVLLGKALFFDEQLSSSRAIACGSCHVLGHGGTDPRTSAVYPGADGVFGTADDVHGSAGVVRHDVTDAPVADQLFGVQAQVTSRRAPPVVNAAYQERLFVDGRADGVFRDPLTGAVVLAAGGALESQIAEPPVSDVEMGHIGRTWADIATDLPTRTPLALASALPTALAQFVAGQTYATLFAQVYGSPGVTPVRIIFAIAAYERSLVSDRSRFDLFLAGQGSLSSLEMRGLAVFQQHCASCHTDLDAAVLTTGPVLDDFRNIGLRPPDEDIGREQVTGQVLDRGKFRVPGLRNVALRSSFMHNGSMQTVTDVIAFYARGGDFARNRDALVTAINGQITANDAGALEALLQALTDPRVANEWPPFDRPRLWLESALVPQTFGIGTGGTVPDSPRISAVGPAYLGDGDFAVGVDRLAPGLITSLLVDVVGSPTPFPAFGHQWNIGWSPGLLLLTLAITAPAPDGAGYASWAFHLGPGAVPPGTYWLQWIAWDANGPAGVVTSNGLRLLVQ